MKFDILPMTYDDIDKVYEIEKICFTLPWSKNMFLDELKNPNSKIFVAKSGEDIYGYGIIMTVLDEGHILNIATHPDYRKMGIGHAIMNVLLNYAIDMNVSLVFLEVRKSNIAAQMLYKVFGFYTIDERKAYYSDNKEDALIMLLNL